MSGFISEPPRSDEERLSGESGHGNESYTQGQRHDRISDMSKTSTAAVTAQGDASSMDISAAQKMLSAVSGSLLTSLLGRQHCSHSDISN